MKFLVAALWIGAGAAAGWLTPRPADAGCVCTTIYEVVELSMVEFSTAGAPENASDQERERWPEQNLYLWAGSREYDADTANVFFISRDPGDDWILSAVPNG